MSRQQPPQPARQDGASLIEALVGLLVVAVGMLGSAQWQVRLRQAVDLARQQSEAGRLAQHEMETLRSFVSNDIRPGLPSFSALASASLSLPTTAGANTSYRLERQVRDSQVASLKELDLLVSWADRGGIAHSLLLSTAIGGQAPALVLPLGQRSPNVHAAPLLGRHAAIPRDAHDLGDERSVFKPLTAGTEAWLFDNRSGRITALCSDVPVAKSNRQLAGTDLGHCVATDLVLLSGRVRQSALLPPATPHASAARELPQPMSITLQLSSAGHSQPPRCLGEAVRMVDIGSPASPRPIAVAIDATAVGQGYAAWSEIDDRFWRYHCAVSLAAAPQWSGRLQITADGWTIGNVAGARRVCRYSADTDGSGRVDRVAESPDEHLGVGDALVEQNFLIVDGAQACPASAASSVAGGSLPWFDGNPATVPHQP